MADTESPVPAAPIIFKKRTAKTTLRKRVPSTSPPPAPATKTASSSGHSSSDNDSDDDDDDANERPSTLSRPHKRRRTAHPSTTTTSTTPTSDLRTSTFAASSTSTLPSTNDATRTSHSSALSATPATHTSQGTQKPMGPVRAPANVRATTMTDFAPDVCKDYKQTGFCGFGDSCKFLHAREDYKAGWELDRDWEAAGHARNANADAGGGVIVSSRAARARRGAPTGDGSVPTGEERDVQSRGDGESDADSDAADEAALAGIPFACVLCRQPYATPVVTRCGHHFCQACARARFRRDPSCAVCGAATGGVFNRARALAKVLERRRVRRERRDAEGVEEGA